MTLSEQELVKLLIYLKRPIPDPAPEWLKLTPEQVTKFNNIQATYNAKLEVLETEKMNALLPVLGVR